MSQNLNGVAGIGINPLSTSSAMFYPPSKSPNQLDQVCNQQIQIEPSFKMLPTQLMKNQGTLTNNGLHPNANDINNQKLYHQNGQMPPHSMPMMGPPQPFTTINNYFENSSHLDQLPPNANLHPQQ